MKKQLQVFDDNKPASEDRIFNRQIVQRKQSCQPELKARKDKQGSIIISGGTEFRKICADHFEGLINREGDDMNWN